jgi:hypothetical protein
MKEDILEQIVEDWLLSMDGVFVKHNVKFRPDNCHKDYVKKTDSSFSDIDVLAVNMNKKKGSCERVYAVTCKSWQSGFKVDEWLKTLTETPNDEKYGKAGWKFFRELVKPKWSDALIKAVEQQTGQSSFTYIIACTKLIGDKKSFEEKKDFLKKTGNNPIVIITLEDMYNSLLIKLTKTVASSQIGRLMQIMKAADLLN